MELVSHFCGQYTLLYFVHWVEGGGREEIIKCVFASVC